MAWKFALKCLAVFVLGTLVDLVWAVHIRALVTGALVVAIVSVVSINFLSFAGQLWFVECPEFSKRLLITAAAAAGAGVGTCLVLALDL